jgi:hypothetical protein
MTERVVLVHGSVMGGRQTWSAQRALRDRFDLVVLERPGFPPNPPVARVDFEEHAVLVAESSETERTSSAIPTAAWCPQPPPCGGGRRSLTVISRPTRVARGSPVADEFTRLGVEWWATGPTDDPEAFLRGFLGYIGAPFDPPSPLPPELEQGARALIAERGPWEAEIPLDALAAAPFPKLVVSGGHHAAFDAVCDVLVERLDAERRVLPGYGHAAQRHPSFNDVLADFVERAAARPHHADSG